MRFLLVCLSLSLAAGPAMALSCMPHDLAQTYAEAAQSDQIYIIVHGKLSFDEALLPKVDWEKQHETPPDTKIPAHLTGVSLTTKGFDAEFDKKIILNAQCFGPWCAGASSGASYLAFLQRTAKGYVLALTPCGGFGFADPEPALLDKVQRCFRGASCEPETFE